MKYIEIQVSGERILSHEQKGNMMGQIQRARAEMVAGKSEHLLANILARTGRLSILSVSP
jgi:hypothetical protein